MSDGVKSNAMVVCASHAPGMVRDLDHQYGLRFRAGIAEAAERVARFDPELVVFFGSDHRRAFIESVPAIAVMTGAEGLGDLQSPTGPYTVPADAAEHLAASLLLRDFDVTVVRKVALDHAFGQTCEQLLGGLSARPIIPIFINCATPPLSGPGRAFALGRAVGEELAATGARVLYIGSGGLSHSPPSMVSPAAGLDDEQRLAMNAAGREAAKKLIRPEWDDRFLRTLAENPSRLADLTSAEVAEAGAGANEVRTWIAAVAAGATPMETIAYEAVADWITGMGVVSTDARVLALDDA